MSEALNSLGGRLECGCCDGTYFGKPISCHYESSIEPCYTKFLFGIIHVVNLQDGEKEIRRSQTVVFTWPHETFKDMADEIGGPISHQVLLDAWDKAGRPMFER